MCRRVAEVHGGTFAADKTANLVARLRHNVIRAGLRRINLAYSRISLQDVAAKLGAAPRSGKRRPYKGLFYTSSVWPVTRRVYLEPLQSEPTLDATRRDAKLGACSTLVTSTLH